LCFYGCETRSVALREEHGIQMCENKDKMEEEDDTKWRWWFTSLIRSWLFLEW